MADLQIGKAPENYAVLPFYAGAAFSVVHGYNPAMGGVRTTWVLCHAAYRGLGSHVYGRMGEYGHDGRHLSVVAGNP